MSEEAKITINGVALAPSQSMTIRVALESFAMSLEQDDALGPDTHGRLMRKNYFENINEIRRALYPMPSGRFLVTLVRARDERRTVEVEAPDRVSAAKKALAECIDSSSTGWQAEATAESVYVVKVEGKGPSHEARVARVREHVVALAVIFALGEVALARRFKLNPRVVGLIGSLLLGAAIAATVLVLGGCADRALVFEYEPIDAKPALDLERTTDFEQAPDHKGDLKNCGGEGQFCCLSETGPWCAAGLSCEATGSLLRCLSMDAQ